MLRTSQWNTKAAFIGLAGVVAALALSAAGCAKNPTSYVDPTSSITTTRTATNLIDAATLRAWMNEGKVNNNAPDTRDRVVILTVTTAAAYATGHIPGSALYLSSDLNASRLEALATLSSEPPDGPTMDAFLQRVGIDEHTTVVFVASAGQNFINPSRAYYTFRYWGFPRERLKVLQSGEAGWTGAGYSLTTAVPTLRASTFSVRSQWDGTGAGFSMRAPIGEMIDLVDRLNNGALSASDPSCPRLLDERGGTNASYMANSGIDDYNQYYVSGANSTFKPTSDILARLATFNVTSSTRMTYVTCASGHRASVLFFVLDGILRWPVRLYDGSSGQWNGYVTANGVGTAWRVDTNTPGTSLARTTGTIPTTSLVLDPVSNAIYTTVLDRRANQIANEDRTYMSTGQTSGGGGGGGGGGGSTSGC